MGKRIIIVTGHYGTGKTNIAINLAIEYAKTQKTVIVDLDVVNPYFRTADNLELLRENGIKAIVPNFANTNLDVPSLPAEVGAAFTGDEEVVVFDVGGDDAGATALGRYSGKIRENGYEMYCVVSKYRPLINTPEAAVGILREIEHASRLTATGIINNSSLGRETSAEDIEKSAEYAEKISEMTGLPVIYTTAVDFFDKKPAVENLKTIRLYTKNLW